MEKKESLRSSIGAAEIVKSATNEELLEIAKEQHDQIVMLWSVVNKLRNKRGDEYEKGYETCMDFIGELNLDEVGEGQLKELYEDLDEIFGEKRHC